MKEFNKININNRISIVRVQNQESKQGLNLVKKCRRKGNG